MLWSWFTKSVSSTDLDPSRRYHSALIVEILNLDVQNLPFNASSVHIRVGSREDSGIYSSPIPPDTSLSWPGSAFQKSKLAIRASSTLFFTFLDGSHMTISDIEVPFAEIMAGFSNDIYSNTFSYRGDDTGNHSIKIQLTIAILDHPEVLPYIHVPDPDELSICPDTHSLQLTSVLKNYMALRNIYAGTESRRLHPLVEVFISSILSLFWSLNEHGKDPVPDTSSQPRVTFGKALQIPVSHPLQDITVQINDLISSLLRNSFTIPQEHQRLLDDVFAELCRYTGMLEEGIEDYKGSTLDKSPDESQATKYRMRQTQLFMLQYRTTLLLYKKKAYREQSIPRATAVRELLEYVCQEDRSHPAPDTNIMGQYERYRRPFTAALASPRGYERENVWNTIVETMKDTSDKAIRITCRRALGRLVCPSDVLPRQLLLPVDMVKLEGLRLRGRFATVLRGKLDRNSSQLYAFRQSLQLEKLLRDPISRPKLFLEFISWRYIDHPRLLPFLGILPVELVQKEEFSTVLVFPWQAEHAASKKNRKRIASKSGGADRRQLIKEIIEGMEYLHSMGIVHGNLKAANIFLNEDQHVLISDYGTWHLADGVQGKLQWSAPELLDMQHADLPIIPTEKSDVWSFACLCVELYTGADPFTGVEESDVRDAVRLRGRYPYLAASVDVPNDLQRILKMCWARIPSDRPSFADIREQLNTWW